MGSVRDKNRGPWLLLLILLALGATLPAGAACPDFDHAHKDLNTLLGRYVRDGGVDYDALLERDKPLLARYLTALESCSASDFEGFTPPQQMAFLINAYNAYTIRIILDHYPVKSIRAIGWIPGSIFKKRLIAMSVLGKAPISLDTIEHEHLRPRYKDPRIHFAVNCASESCPALRREAYVAERLDAQLDEQGREFLSDPEKNRLEGTQVQLSMIFKWFAEDFLEQGGSAQFAARFAPPEFQAALKKNPRVTYRTYDWSLNKRSQTERTEKRE